VWAKPFTFPGVQLKLKTSQALSGKKGGGSKAIRIRANQSDVIYIRIETHFRKGGRNFGKSPLNSDTEIKATQRRSLASTVSGQNLRKELVLEIVEQLGIRSVFKHEDPPE
jgi:hypothetical protein